MPTQGVGIARRRVEPQVERPSGRSDLASIVKDLQRMSSMLESTLDYVRLVDDQLSKELATPKPTRKAAVTGVVPSATLDTYGAATEIEPTSGYAALVLLHAALTSGGTFGAETLTVKIEATHSDLTTSLVEKTFVATGVETALTNADLHDLMKEATWTLKLAISAKSSINNSTATGGCKVAAVNA